MKIFVSGCIGLLSLLAAPAIAQEFSFGLVGGMELNSDFQFRAGSTRQFVLEDGPVTFHRAFERSRRLPKLGLKLEYAFTSAWSVESGILMHRPTFTSTDTYDPPLRSSPGGPLISRFTTRYEEPIWEVPLLLKRRVAAGRRTLILEGGASFRPFGGIDGPGRFGATAGLGTEWRAKRVRLEPSIRYTRWSDVRQPVIPAPFRRDEISLLLAADASGSTLRGGTGREPLSVGFIGGTTLTKAFPNKDGWEGLRSRLAGVAVEYRFTNHWSGETDAIYHPLVLSERARATVVTWEVPVLAKYRFGSEWARPFVTGGPTFRASGNRNSTNPSTVGVTAGVGVEVRAGRVSFEPTLRYVRWRNDPFVEHSPAATRSDQVQMMLAIRLGGK